MEKGEVEPVLISFAKLGEILYKRGKKWQYLRDQGISPAIVAKLKNGSGHVDTRTIQKLCEILHCQPGQIMEYVAMIPEVKVEDPKDVVNEFDGVPFM